MLFRSLMMAMLLPLVEEPIYGDAWLKGTGEVLRLRYSNLYINQVRKAVTKLSGRMSNQRLKAFQMMTKAQPELIKYWSAWMNAEMFRAVWDGSSPQLTAGTNDEGLGLLVRYHPNMYSAITDATGELSAIGTEHALKTAAQIGTDLNKDHYVISARLFQELNILLKTKIKMRPIIHNDIEMYLMLVTPDGLNQAKNDPDIRGVQNSAYARELGSHPAIKGRDYIVYEGIVAMEERVGVRTTTKGNHGTMANLDAALTGTNGWMNPPARQANHLNIVLGADAFGLGIAENLTYTEEEDDHKNVIELGSRCIRGANRIEYVADDVHPNVFAKANATRAAYDAATPAINESSAIIITGTKANT